MPTSLVPRIYNSTGADLPLSGELGEGGEAKVYGIAGDPSRVLKVYLKPPPPDQLSKLQAMAALKNADLLGVTTWPLDVAFVKSNIFAGYTMPRLSEFHPVHTLFNPKARQRLYPNMSWRSLIVMAANVAQSIAVLHHYNIVMGDVNANNIIVHDDTKITLVDCDSFAFTYNGVHYPCRVGMDEYQPPELQPDRWSRQPRTPEGDRFGLAIIIFQLLMMGRHPFEGVRSSGKIIDPTRAGNIARGYFFYAPDAPAHGLRPPPASLTFGALTPAIGKLFVRAFAESPSQRPTALEWHGALVDFDAQLVRCPKNATHLYLRSSICPWCAIERETKGQISFFQLPVPVGRDGKIDDTIWTSFPDSKLTELWRAIVGIGAAPAVYVPTRRPLRALTLKPKPVSRELFKSGLLFAGAMVVAWTIVAVLLFTHHVAIAGGLSLLVVSAWRLTRIKGGRELDSRSDSLINARLNFDRAEERWRALGTASEYRELFSTLEKTANSLIGQRQRYDAEIGALKSRQQEINRRAFLDGQLIASAKIKGVGSALGARLAAWNIESALDVNYGRIISVPGFGEAKAGALLAWRNSLEVQFNRRPPAAIDPSVLAPITTNYVRARVAGRNELLAGKNSLARLVEDLTKNAPKAQAEATAARAMLDQAIVDAAVMPRWIYRTS